uniref:SEFIR domain-containing protein n=1 Tax=Mola mola TaxID=94237 RepID=A0A3Q4BP28_MOLML
ARTPPLEMAHAPLQVRRVSLLLLSLLSATALEMVDQHAPELTCSETRSLFSTVSLYAAALLDPDDTVNVTHLQLKAILCCSARQDCEPCLQIIITVQGLSNISSVLMPGHVMTSLVKVCLSSPGSSESCKTLQFKLWEHGSGFSVSAPRLRAVTNHERNELLLQVDNANAIQDEIMWQMVWNEMPGEVLAWPKGRNEIVMSSTIAVPCLCFQVWWKGKALRRQFCPFKNQQDALERMQPSVSVLMVECQMRDGSRGLRWNVTAPCRLEAEVWLCKKELHGGLCTEVTGSRQQVHNTVSTCHTTLLKYVLLHCTMKIRGIKSHIQPQCPFATSQWRWSLPLVTGFILVCLAIVGVYFMQGVLRGYVWRWLKEEDVKGAVGGGHVLLLYRPDDDQALPELMSRLGSSLQTLGFSVSLDLWNQGELSALGPVPWLHSRLSQLKKQGGKVVVVLTQASWLRAEEWAVRSWEKNTTGERSRDMKEGEAGRGCTASSASVDVFTASLSCILADYLQGRAGERFMLLQFESLPPEPPGGFRPLPELFRGLHVYSLPSQSLGFLTELAGARHRGTASARRKRAGGLRVASRVLARGLSGFTAEGTVLYLAGASRTCVAVGVEDLGETVSLQPCLGLITPPSSPDISPKVDQMDWV